MKTYNCKIKWLELKELQETTEAPNKIAAITAVYDGLQETIQIAKGLKITAKVAK